MFNASLAIDFIELSGNNYFIFIIQQFAFFQSNTSGSSDKSAKESVELIQDPDSDTELQVAMTDSNQRLKDLKASENTLRSELNYLTKEANLQGLDDPQRVTYLINRILELEAIEGELLSQINTLEDSLKVKKIVTLHFILLLLTLYNCLSVCLLSVCNKRTRIARSRFNGQQSFRSAN